MSTRSETNDTNVSNEDMTNPEPVKESTISPASANDATKRAAYRTACAAARDALDNGAAFSDARIAAERALTDRGADSTFRDIAYSATTDAANAAAAAAKRAEAARAMLARGDLRYILRAILEANEDYNDASDEPFHNAADEAHMRRADAILVAEEALRSDPVVSALLDIIEAERVDIENCCGPDNRHVPDLFDLLGETRLYDLAYAKNTDAKAEVLP